MRKVFVDLGANQGEVVDELLESRIGKDFKIFCFEPNDRFQDVLKSKPLTELFVAVAGTEDGFVDFRIDSSQTGYGSSLVLSKLTGYLSEPEKIRSINFSRWLLENFSKNDYLILKCDIEGFEYDLFPHLQESGALGLINCLMIDIHPNSKLSIDSNIFSQKYASFMKSMEKMTENNSLIYQNSPIGPRRKSKNFFDIVFEDIKKKQGIDLEDSNQ